MQDLLDEFDPLSIKDPLLVKSSAPAPALALPRNQPIQAHPPSKARSSNHSAPLFSTALPQRLPSSPHRSQEHSDHPPSSGTGIGKINPSTDRLSADDNDPLGLLSQADAAPGQSAQAGINRKPDDLLLEAQRRSKLRQEALAKHLAHEPFRPASPGQPAASRDPPLITLANLEREPVTCFMSPTSSRSSVSHDSSKLASPPLPTATMRIPTDVFQNRVAKAKNNRAQSTSSSSSSRSRTRLEPQMTTAVDKQKLAAALDEGFDAFVSGPPHAADVTPKSNSPPVFQREFELRKSSGTSGSPSGAVASGRSTPSFFDGPEGRPAPIHLGGIDSQSQLVMDDELAEGIRLHLPPRLRIPAAWTLLYSLDQHGTSLGTLYQRVQQTMAADATAGCVLALRDADGNRFGAFVNEAFRPSKEYYGSGECFLWKAMMFEPGDFRIGVTVRAYLWTGANDYMVLSDHDLLSVGGGDGKFGLWIDSNLEKGASARCPAFNNEVLCSKVERTASGREEGSFEIIGLECWMIAV